MSIATSQPLTKALIDELIEHLGARRSGNGYSARCPVPEHNDNHPSLTFTVANNGRWVWMECRAGCSIDKVCNSLPPGFRSLVRESGESTMPAVKKISDATTNGATTKRGTPTKYYEYQLENGDVSYRSVRLEPKGFYQQRPDGNGGWIMGMAGVTPTIYHLPEVLAAAKAGEIIYVAEGEKDVDALRELGVVATCNSGGAQKFRDEFGKHFDGASIVVVIADNDGAGLKHARQVSDIMQARRIPVQVVRAAEGKDAYDHLEAGHKIEDFVPIPDEELPASSQNGANSEAIASSVPEAITSMAGNLFLIGKTTKVVIGGPSHGLYHVKLAQDEAGNWTETPEQLTDWVAWRPEVVTQLRINDRYLGEPVGNEEYTVEVVTSTGKRYLRPGLKARESTSARDVIDVTNAGVELPIARPHQAMADNMLRTLGHSNQRTVASYTSVGWCYPDGETPVYLCPNGSISPNGVTNEFVVGPPTGSDTAGLSTAMRRTGFSNAEVPASEAASAIRAFCEIAPSRPEIPIALLGLVFSTPLRLSSRSVVVLTGETDAGKTLLSSAVQSFFSEVVVGGKDSSSLYIPQSSPIGAAGVMAWHRDALAVCDDYRRTDDDRVANARMTEVMATIVQSAYGAPPGAKATQTGGMRGSRDQAASALITAEVSADQAAIRNRSITLLLGRADRITAVGGPFDAFKAEAKSGAARSIIAHYITYLARRVAAKENGLDRLTKNMNRRASEHYKNLNGNRNAETVAALACGWEVFREFAVEAGIESFLPSKTAVDVALRKLAASNADSAAESDPGRRVIAQISAMLAGNHGHLLSCTDGRPIIDGHSPGWIRSITSGPHGDTERWDRAGSMLGWISKDGAMVLVPRIGIQSAIHAARLDGLALAQVYDAVARLAAQGTTPGKRCPTSFGMFRRPAGFVLPADLFDLGSVIESPTPLSPDTAELIYEDY